MNRPLDKNRAKQKTSDHFISIVFYLFDADLLLIWTNSFGFARRSKSLQESVLPDQLSSNSLSLSVC